MNNKQEVLKNLPAVDKLLLMQEVQELLATYGKERVIFCIRNTLNNFRHKILQGSAPPTKGDIIAHSKRLLSIISERSLKRVINATGIIIHTNLGRAPFSRAFIEESASVLEGYNNLEFDLETAGRGSRHVHAADILKFLTGAEDVLVVNNAAAAVMLILRTFAKRKEVIVSRSELIEIGGSFRLPEIMKASDCKMVEVGTTNKTRASDFENAVSPKTALIFKAHKSNYVIKGFTEEVQLSELVQIGNKNKLPVVYDLGSGLLRNDIHPVFKDECSATEAISSGVDLVCFSGDKLLGGPQSGIIAGKKELIARLKKEPMLRALRVCKTTLAMLETVCRYHLDTTVLKEKSMLYKTLFRSQESLRTQAENLKVLLEVKGINVSVVESFGYVGGGTMPETTTASFALAIEAGLSRKENELCAEKMYLALMKRDIPVAGILRKGTLLFDVLTMHEDETEAFVSAVSEEYLKVIPVKKKYVL